MKKKKEIIKISIFITSIFVIFLSVTYAFINVTLTGTKQQIITAGDISLVLEEDENNLTIENALPMYDEVGMIQEDLFTFRLVNNGTANTNYIVKLVAVTNGNNKLSTNDVRYYLTKNGVGILESLSSLSDGVIDTGTIARDQTIHYTLRLWIRDGVTDNSSISGKSLSYRIDVEAEQLILDENGCEILPETEPNEPILASGMIPVIYDEEQESWVKADTTNTWYDYSNQMWANAVTVTEENRSTYMSSEAGTAISTDDINTMWVWIPRYEYQYTDLGNNYAGGSQKTPGEIKINFIPTLQVTPSDNSVYKIPEGFTFGDEELSGFWVGKFETTGSMSASCTDENCTTADLSIKPNLASVTGQTLSSLFYGIRSMQNANNASKHGFDVIGSSTQDIHMTKNTEWGIVAYLSQSKYGKYGNPSYSGANKEIYQNKSTSYITGMSSGMPGQVNGSTQLVPYDTPNTGYGASTTGTIYGVYDMSGGASENVMGNYNNMAGFSDFTSFPDGKYYDLYTSASASVGYKAGDATYETVGWYMDLSVSWGSLGMWIRRGGSNTSISDAGVFQYSGASGNTGSGTRCSLKP